MRKLKVYETAQAPNQFTSTTKLPAAPFTFIGKICLGKYIKFVLNLGHFEFTLLIFIFKERH